MAPGPIPKRSEERRRRNKDSKPEIVAVPGKVKPQPCPNGIHPEARGWYKSLGQSAESRYWEPSDWRQARIAAIWLSGLLSGSRPSAQMVASWLSMVSELGVTEGARRRMRIEIDRRGPIESADVTEMDEYRRARQG